MMKFLITWAAGLLCAASVFGQDPQVPGGRMTDTVAQPTHWVAFQSTIERDGLEVGRFWRDATGSTRLELFAPDAEGRTIILEHIPGATYYVYRPAAGWTAQPMLLPSTGWFPQPVGRTEAGSPLAAPVEGFQVLERVTPDTREQRVAALNFLPLVRQGLADGTIERHRRVQIGPVAGSLFVPPPGAVVVPLSEPGGIIALPAPKGGVQ